MAKEEEEKVQIPESVLGRANTRFRESAMGSPFTPEEKTKLKLPQFPFGGMSSTSVDSEFGGPIRFPYSDSVQYERDRDSRMANRYLSPISNAANDPDERTNPFGSRMDAVLPFQSYAAKEFGGYGYNAEGIEDSNQSLNQSLPSIPDVGTSGFSRSGNNFAGYEYASTTEQIVSPFGSATTTLSPQQVQQREQSVRQAQESGTMPRTPEQQQAALDRIRQNAPALNQQRTDWVMNTIQQRRDNPTTYITPSGRSATVPTNQRGEPIKAWVDQLSGQGLLSSQRPKRTPASTMAATGFGAMQREQQESMPQPLGRSPLFADMGYTAAFGGGPQPARSMMAYDDQEDGRDRLRGRFRRMLNLV
jgi:hypothetical protein